MMAETEVKKEVSKALEIGEKCGLDMNSFQDLPKAKCNGTNRCNEANDLDNSYIFVTGTDGLPNDPIDNKDVAAEDLSVSPESKAAAIEDQGAESVSQNEKLTAFGREVNEHLNEGENASIKRSNEDPCIVNDSTWKEENSLEDGERVQDSVADSLEGHTGEIGSLTEVEKLENPGGRVESLKEAEAENVGGPKGTIERVVEGKQENFDDITKPGSPPGSAENKESEVEALELASESAEKGELDNISLHLSSSVNAHNKSEDQINLNTTEALEACQGSQNMVVDVVGLNMQVASVGAEDEVKLTNEAVETMEHEFPASASLDPDLENSIKEETLKKEAKTTLTVDVLENQQCDTALGSNDQGVLEQKDEAKAVASSSDCHAEKQESQVGVLGFVAESGEKGGLGNILLHLNDSGNANDRCEDLINLNAIEALETCPGSQGAVVDVVELKLQDLSMGAETDNDVQLTREAVETAEHEFPPSTSLDSDLESYLTKEEAFKEEANTTVSLDVPENQQCDTTVGNNVQGVPEHIDDAKSVVSSTDCHVEIVRDLVLEEKKEDFSVSHVDNRIQSPEEPDINSDNSRLASETMQSETETEASVPTESMAASNARAPQADIESSDAEAIGAFSPSLVDGPKSEITVKVLPSQPEIESSDAEAIGPASSFLVDGPKSEITEKGLPSHPEVECSDAEPSGAVSSLVDGPKSEITEKRLRSHPEIECSDVEAIEAVSSSLVDGPKSERIEKGLPSDDSWLRCAANEASSGSETTFDVVVLTEKKQILQSGEAHAETEVSIGEAIAADIPPTTFDVKFEPEVSVHSISAISSGERTSDVIVACRTEVLDGYNINEDDEANIVEIEGVGDQADQLVGSAGSSSEKFFLQENEDSGDSHSYNNSVASLEGSGANMTNGEEASIKTKPKPFNFLVRVPRFDDESLRERIRLAKLHVDEKTKLRDAIQAQIQEIRANSQIHGIDYEYAKVEGRGARKLVRSKRMEIDSLQSVINKAKNALSIEDIDSQIHNMEHMIQHETLPLKEEKQIIREIKQLKQLREQLSFNMGSQDEIKQALEQREEVEERLKILRKELDTLKDRVLKAEAIAMEAEKKYDHENKKVKELQAQFRAADDVRQAAYAQWQSQRKELLKKSKHFFKYKDDAAVASNYAFSRDTEALYDLCTKHVDNFMELWNTNNEFRREYVKFNARSTIRRFGTLDGRSLGPDEEPHILPRYVDDRANRMVSTPVKADPASQVPPPYLKQETTVEIVTSDGKLTKHVTEDKNQKVTKKGPAETVQVKGLDTDSGRDINDEVDEEPKKSKEEIEAIRKAEEMRRKEAEAKLKEQRRLEELAKANEARERKKRQAEKQQMRAELKAQKEAEEREKEKEKRLRKKERKKAAATDASDTKNNSEPPPSSESAEETSKDIEVKDMSSVKAKKAQKPWFTKQNKTKSVPPPLRNRNKKKWQQWMWVAIASLIIFALFWLGNIGVFSNVNFRRRSPIH